jgi:hypothetical protein
MEFKRPILINDLTELVIGLCIKIHSRIDLVVLKVYEEILYYELTKLGLVVKGSYSFQLIMKSFT